MNNIYNLPEDLNLVPAELLKVFKSLPNKIDKYAKKLPDQISEDYMRKNNFVYYKCSKTGKFDSLRKMTFNPYTKERHLKDEFI